MHREESRIVRIAVFYDGNFFYHASNYYYFEHPLRMRLSIQGLHEFVRYEVARRETVGLPYCQIVDAHYFRGRLMAQEADERQVLLQERLFDDVLMREGIVTHYLPIGRQGEKGIDVWLALEALELATMKQFDVLALIAGDSDYVPLIRKLNNIGTRVMVLGWDFKFEDSNGVLRRTSTSSRLFDEASYPIQMQKVLDDNSRRQDPVIRNLFVPAERGNVAARGTASREVGNGMPMADGMDDSESLSRLAPDVAVDPDARIKGPIRLLKSGYGFVGSDVPGRDLFFVWHDLENATFDELSEGDFLEYSVGANERGEFACRLIRIQQAPDQDGIADTPHPTVSEERFLGRIVALKNGYGFIGTDEDGHDLFFVKSDLENIDFDSLKDGDMIEYELGVNDRGECARRLRRLAAMENAQTSGETC